MNEVNDLKWFRRFGRIDICDKEDPIEDGKIPYHIQSCRYNFY